MTNPPTKPTSNPHLTKFTETSLNQNGRKKHQIEMYPSMIKVAYKPNERVKIYDTLEKRSPQGEIVGAPICVGEASPLRVATGGNANWKFEVRCRRSPAHANRRRDFPLGSQKLPTLIVSPCRYSDTPHPNEQQKNMKNQKFSFCPCTNMNR
jgi:hypothetical protein